MNRLYVVESMLSNTGAMADHRLPMRASEIERFAGAVANELGVKTGADHPDHNQWVTALVRDLQKHQGSSIVLAGEQQPPSVHALAHALNHVLGNVGKTVVYTDSVEADPGNQLASLRELVRDMEAGQVDLLVIADSNPVFTAPADLRFAEHLLKVKRRIHMGLYQDETATLCHWHVPQAHYLESWSDARAFDGTVTILQPLIAPLYDGKSIHQLLSVLSGRPQRSSHDIVREYWGKPARFRKFRGLLANCAARRIACRHSAPPQASVLEGGLPEAGWRNGSADCSRGCRRTVRNSRARNRISPRPNHLGRQVRQQRVAAGIAEAPHQTDLGQCGLDQPSHGRAARPS